MSDAVRILEQAVSMLDPADFKRFAERFDDIRRRVAIDAAQPSKQPIYHPQQPFLPGNYDQDFGRQVEPRGYPVNMTYDVIRPTDR